MLTPSWGLMVWTVITFGLAVFILWRYAFGPLQSYIDARRDRVQESIRTADEAREEAQQLLDEYKQTLAQVRHEADEILERSRKAGEQVRQEVVGEAKSEAERLVTRAHEQIERDTQAALQQLRSEVGELTLLAAEKLAGKSLTDADHRRLIDEALADALKEANLENLELGQSPN